MISFILEVVGIVTVVAAVAAVVAIRFKQLSVTLKDANGNVKKFGSL